MKSFIICYSSSNIITVFKSRRMRWEGYVERMEEEDESMHDISWKTRGSETTRNKRRRLVDNIEMVLGKKRLDVVDWIGLAQDRYKRRTLVKW
jgi:hypothetical protein